MLSGSQQKEDTGHVQKGFRLKSIQGYKAETEDEDDIPEGSAVGVGSRPVGGLQEMTFGGDRPASGFFNSPQTVVREAFASSGASVVTALRQAGGDVTPVPKTVVSVRGRPTPRLSHATVLLLVAVAPFLHPE